MGVSWIISDSTLESSKLSLIALIRGCFPWPHLKRKIQNTTYYVPGEYILGVTWVVSSKLNLNYYLFLKSSKSRAQTIPPPSFIDFIKFTFFFIISTSSNDTHWLPLYAYGPIRCCGSFTTCHPLFLIRSQI
jgi:hypothetical protein